MNKRTALILSILSLSRLLAFSQEHKQEFPINFGLTISLPDSMLPKSKAQPMRAIRQEKKNPETKLESQANGGWRLTGGWELADDDMVVGSKGSIFDENYDTSSWHNAVVPGTVLTTLVDAGIYPDPY